MTVMPFKKDVIRKEVFLILRPQLEQKGLKAKVDMVQEET